MNLKTPYIGVTGFMTQGEVEKVLTGLPKIRHKIMVGVLASSKTLNKEKNNWPNRYPETEKISEIFTNDSMAFNLIHYHTKKVVDLCEQLIEITEMGGRNLHGLQLNIEWPTVKELYEYRCNFPEKQLVLQVNNSAFNQVDNCSKLLAKKVSDYGDTIDYVLLDHSDGLGLNLNINVAKQCLETLLSMDLHLGLAIAGGLSSRTIWTIEELIDSYTGLSIDAEGKLRDENDRLSVVRTLQYIHDTLKLFGEI